MALFQKPTCDWLIVGLGNPGKQYAKTRHNMGFCALDVLSGKLGVSLKKAKFQALTASATYHGKKLVLVQPQTFMNASGLSVGPAASFYKVPPERIIVLFDDISLPVGKIRIRANGSAGGHNGIKSIISVLKSEDFPRVKIGVGAKPNPEYDLADWVLAPIPKSEQPQVLTALEHAADAALCIVDAGCGEAAGKFNGL
ncbi:MAG: aminoacyl-tRNA hydrolase [Oscillospiraceae bacterium]|nr:aminoacyl-tRNA hydrolase [Oscillospiraceae bacterium]